MLIVAMVSLNLHLSKEGRVTQLSALTAKVRDLQLLQTFIRRLKPRFNKNNKIA